MQHINRKSLKAIIGILLLIFSLFVAFGYLTYNRKNNHEIDLFSVDNVVKDIEFISAEPHSLLHPLERSKVRTYLFDRLKEMGGNPVLLPQDSIESKVGGYFDISDVYCRFDPDGRDSASSYIMFVAHLDSSFPQQVIDKKVNSFGAADDGYGVGVVLELLRGALSYNNCWQRQGIKILFTDGEENKFDGMRTALERYNYIFDNTGLIINVEARGVKGPALMFETSNHNRKLIDFYLENANNPFIYSLMGTVYDFMPYFSDFTLVKRIFPGYNISVIDNVNYYHTDKDCFDNINIKSLGHYGAQLQPMVKKFLTCSDYSEPDYFRPDENDKSPLVFSVPGLGTFRFSKNGYYFFNAIVFFLFCVVLCFYVIMRRVELKNVFKQMLKLFIVSLIVFAAGEGIAFLAAKIVGTPFKLLSTRYIQGDSIIGLSATVVMGIIYIVFFVKGKRKSDSFVFEHLLGALLLMILFSAVLLGLLGDNFFLMGPIACAVAALLFHIFIYMNILSLPALLAIELLAISFLYILFTALTIGSLGIIMFLAFFYIVIIVSLFECYMTQKR